MKKVLVLVADYPNNNGGVALMYVHVRNKYYVQHDIDVTVLNFAALEDYVIDGISVITLKEYEKQSKLYDVLVLHASNIRNHYKFLKKYDNRFPHIIFFYHGHECVRINEVYPEPYDYMKKGKFRVAFQDLYDSFKLSIWNKYLPKVAYKSDYVFVSNWLYQEFQKYVGLENSDLHNHVHVINNSVGEEFERYSYQYQGDKTYDFITIRSYMDDSKYCVDLVNELAEKYFQYSFLIIGRGKYYDTHKKPNNVTWIDRFLTHKEIRDYIDQSRCGLLLTREDTQGVMTCELAEYGIPVITSDIDVCKEICGDLKNVELISNNLSESDLTQIYNSLLLGIPYSKQGKFSYKNTVEIEESLITAALKRGTTS